MPARRATAALCLSTASSEEEGARIARTLVEEGLAACVNLVPGVRSIYRWQGKLEDGPEVLLLIKTKMGVVDDLRRRLQTLHSYSVPELVALEVVGGNPDYLRWVEESVPRPRRKR